MPTTAAGIPYPTTQDPLAQTPRYVRELDAAAQARLANRPVVVRNTPITTDANGDFTIAFPEFSTLSGLIVQQGHPLDYPFIAVCMALTGNTARVQLVRIWRTASNANQQPNTTGIFANVSVYVLVLAWGVPV